MYDVFLKVFVKIGEGEDASYGCSELRKPLTAEQLANPAELEKLAAEALDNISKDPEVGDEVVTAVSYDEYHEFERKQAMAEMMEHSLMDLLGGLGGESGMGVSIADLLAGHDCATCDAEDCPSRKASGDELN